MIWDLRSAALRPDGFTSADAAGLPIFPGLVRYDEAAAGHINHAIRVTVSSTQDAWVHPASHCAGSTSSSSAPPMGLRLRLSAGYDISGITGPAHAIAVALKQYGVIVADNGSNWFISGTSDRRWSGREPRSAQVDPGLGLPGRAKRRSHPALLSDSGGELTIRTPMNARTRPITAPSWSGWPRIGTPAIAVVAGTR